MIQKKTSLSIIKSICEGGTYGLGSAQSGINHWWSPKKIPPNKEKLVYQVQTVGRRGMSTTNAIFTNYTLMSWFILIWLGSNRPTLKRATVWKFKNFSASQILREIKVGEFRVGSSENSMPCSPTCMLSYMENFM